MANINLYATLAEYKAYSTARNQVANPDTTDDNLICDLLEVASRYLDDKTNRQFYPSVETRLYDIPSDAELLLDQDLLEVTTLTNGDATVLTTTDYILRPNNVTPYYSIRLKDISSKDWEANASDSSQQVISVLGWWGYRQKYSQRAWASVGTLGAAIADTASLAFTMASGHTVTAGQILKINNEILNVASVATNTVTAIARGDNGSTAATHLISTTVYKWQPQEEVHNACLEIANSAYQRRFGRATGESATITAAGVVLTPRDIPAMAEECIRSFMRWV